MCGGEQDGQEELCHGVAGDSEDGTGTEAAPHPNAAPQGCRQPSPPLPVPHRWFHGKITREQAERLLYPPETGLFLVRESTNYPGDYTLCVSCEGKVEHYRIIYSSSKLSIDEEVYFENLMQLVEVRPGGVGVERWSGDVGDAGDGWTEGPAGGTASHPWPRAATWWDLRARHRRGVTHTALLSPALHHGRGRALHPPHQTQADGGHGGSAGRVLPQ